MWHKEFKDYPPDEPLKKCRVESGKGIIGCEMHEINGYGMSLHVRKGEKRVSQFMEAIEKSQGRGYDTER